jgi:hypothetical protein
MARLDWPSQRAAQHSVHYIQLFSLAAAPFAASSHTSLVYFPCNVVYLSDSSPSPF